MQQSTDQLTAAQAATAGRVLADLIRAWADPHRRDSVREIVNLGPGDAHEDMQALQAARVALASTDQARVQRLLADADTTTNLIGTATAGQIEAGRTQR